MNAVSIALGLSAVAALSATIPHPAARPGPVELAAPADTPNPVHAWMRRPGALRVALQAGHWKAEDAPSEQRHLRENGTRGGGRAEWEVNLAIARRTAKLLEKAGYTVDILPTTIPPGYWADVFIAIHADGNSSASVSGYRAAAPRRDRTGRADDLVRVLTRTYGASTKLRRYPTVTRRMRGYYAFNSERYRHALHPMTVGVILETGFLTSPRDRRVIIGAQDRAARGIADAVIEFLGLPEEHRAPLSAPLGTPVR